MNAPQDWAPYSSLDEAARVYLRDSGLALEQLRAVVDFATVTSFIMSRGVTDEPWGEALWQEIALPYSLALRLRSAGVAAEVVCEYVDVDPESLDGFYRIAEAKLTSALRRACPESAGLG